MRVELRDGQWAELRERITHGAHKAIRRTWDDSVQLETAVVHAFVREWNVRHPDTGAVVEIGAIDVVDQAPSDIVDLIFLQAKDLYIKATVPNLPTPPSSDDSSSPAGGDE